MVVENHLQFENELCGLLLVAGKFRFSDLARCVVGEGRAL